MLFSLLRSLKCRQVGQVQLNISVNGTASTPAASGPEAQFVQSVTDLGNGNYTITLKEAAQALLHVSSLVTATDQTVGRVTAVTSSSVTVQFDDPADGSAKNADFSIQIQYQSQLSYFF
jgi:hypothetical protein